MQVSGSAGLFDLVSKLADGRALKPEEVGTAVGLKLVPDKGDSTPYFAVFRSKPEPAASSGSMGITAVELRTPRKPEPGQGSLLILDVDAALGIGQKDTMARFGDKPELSVPTPHQPASAPVYLAYKKPWGTLRFGFARAKAQAMISIVIDATEHE